MEKEATILAVDDEERNLRLLNAILLPQRYQVVYALSGEEAIQRLDEVNPDLVLLDVMMPGMNGFEVCRKIKGSKMHKALPIIMVTSLTSNKDRISAMNAGADDFLSKPIDKTELLIRVKSLLRIKAYHDKLGKNLQEIQEKNEQLSQLEKMKEELTHMIIHDLNIPLAGIIGCLEMVLTDKEKLSDDHAEWLTDSVNQSRYLSGIIMNILDINKMEEGKLQLNRQSTDIMQLIENAIGLLNGKIMGKKTSISFVKPEDVPPLEIDPDLIKRVFANLLDNAIRHTPAGEEIEIQVRPDKEEKTVHLRIKDRGKGLNPDYHEMVFEKYKQFDNGENGEMSGRSGLGLVFCKMAVEAHGGKIWVESSAQKKGTTFCFAVPIKDSDN